MYKLNRMSLFSLAEKLNLLTCSCFGITNKDSKRRRLLQKQYDMGRKLVDIGDKYNITTLPVMIGRELVDLYPPTNHVEKWNVLIVGKNKNYILVNLKDIHIPNTEFLPNNQGDPFLPKEVSDFFNHVWDKTLSGNELQFFMMWNGKTYFVNTYRFLNGAHEVIGAIMFMRLLDLIPNFVTKQERDSIDFMAENNIFKTKN